MTTLYKPVLAHFDSVDSAPDETRCIRLSESSIRLVLSISQQFYWPSRWSKAGTDYSLFSHAERERMLEYASKLEAELMGPACGEYNEESDTQAAIGRIRTYFLGTATPEKEQDIMQSFVLDIRSINGQLEVLRPGPCGQCTWERVGLGLSGTSPVSEENTVQNAMSVGALLGAAGYGAGGDYEAHEPANWTNAPGSAIGLTGQGNEITKCAKATAIVEWVWSLATGFIGTGADTIEEINDIGIIVTQVSLLLGQYQIAALAGVVTAIYDALQVSGADIEALRSFVTDENKVELTCAIYPELPDGYFSARDFQAALSAILEAPVVGEPVKNILKRFVYGLKPADALKIAEMVANGETSCGCPAVNENIAGSVDTGEDKRTLQLHSLAVGWGDGGADSTIGRYNSEWYTSFTKPKLFPSGSWDGNAFLTEFMHHNGANNQFNYGVGFIIDAGGIVHWDYIKLFKEELVGSGQGDRCAVASFDEDAGVWVPVWATEFDNSYMDMSNVEMLAQPINRDSRYLLVLVSLYHPSDGFTSLEFYPTFAFTWKGNDIDGKRIGFTVSDDS